MAAAGLAAIVLIAVFGCPFETLLGIPCPGCGMSRAFICLFHLDLRGAFIYHPLFPLVIAWPIAYAIYAMYFLKRREFAYHLPPGRVGGRGGGGACAAGGNSDGGACATGGREGRGGSAVGSGGGGACAAGGRSKDGAYAADRSEGRVASAVVGRPPLMEAAGTFFSSRLVMGLAVCSISAYFAVYLLRVVTPLLGIGDPFYLHMLLVE